MRAVPLVIALLLAPVTASAQPSRPGRSASVIAPGSSRVEARIAQARALLDAGRFAEAETSVARLSARARLRDDVTWIALRARAGVLGVSSESGTTRSAASIAATRQADLVTLGRRTARFTDAHPDDADAMLLRARVELASGALDAALASLDTVVRLRANDPVAANDRAMVLAALHRLPDAEQALVTVTQLAPHDADPWDNLGAVRLARGEGNAAVEAFTLAVQNAPAVARFHSDLGSALLATGHADQAVASYRHATELSPADGVLWSNLGYALALSNHLDDALATLRHAVEVSPASTGAWYNLGTVLLRRGDPTGAHAAFQHALAIDPNDARTRAAMDAMGSTTVGAPP